MILIYATLNNQEEARKIGRRILEEKLANCVNFFPINCIYSYENEIKEEPEIVIIIKTKKEKFEQVEKLIKSEINYTNFIGQLEINKANAEFLKWLDGVV